MVVCGGKQQLHCLMPLVVLLLVCVGAGEAARHMSILGGVAGSEMWGVVDGGHNRNAGHCAAGGW